MQDGPNFVVVAGLSGAGRSTVADTLEDLGWFVIDNLPSSLLSSAAELLTAADPRVQRLGHISTKKISWTSWQVSTRPQPE